MALHPVSAFKLAFWRPVDPTDPFDGVNRFSMRAGLAIAAAMALAVIDRMATLAPFARDLACFLTVLFVITTIIVCRPAPFPGLPS